MKMEEVLDVAEQLVDTKKVSAQKEKAGKIANPFGHSFAAIAKYREEIKKKDPFFFYECNDRNLCGKPSSVFKSSRAQLELLVKMDKDNVGVLSSEYVFVDAKAD